MGEAKRVKVMHYLADERHAALFGDGLEWDYIYDGFPHKGLNQMTDAELLEELCQVDPDNDLGLLPQSWS